MEKIEVDPIPDALLPIKNVYKIAAITWVLDMIMKHRLRYTEELSEEERSKVQIEIDKIIDGLMNKRRKLHGK